MANLPEVSSFDEGVYQLELTDPVVGGANGVSNAPLRSLVNRTRYLKEHFENHVDDPNPHPQYDPGEAVAAHLLAPNPHPQYVTDEVIAAHLSADDPHPLASASWIGVVEPFARPSAPTGWLKANGAAVSRTAYAALFAAIGTLWGAGDGSTTFNLPDIRADFLRGWDDGRGVDIGRVFGSFQADALIAHSHSIKHSFDGVTGAGLDQYWGAGGSADACIGQTPAGASETRPRNTALLFCIRYR